MLVEQNGLCAICSTDIRDDPSVDHDHETKVIRGLLCRQCNASLGQFGDSIEGVTRVLVYLRRNLN